MMGVLIGLAIVAGAVLVLFGPPYLISLWRDVENLHKRNLELADQVLKAEKDCEESDLELAELVEQRDAAQSETVRQTILCRDVVAERDKAQNEALHATIKLRDFEGEMKRAKDDAARSERDYLSLKQQYETLKTIRNDWERKFNEVKALAEEEHAKALDMRYRADASADREGKLAHELRQMREKYNETHAQLCQADDRQKELVHKIDCRDTVIEAWEETVRSITADFDRDRQQWAKALDAQQKRVEELERCLEMFKDNLEERHARVVELERDIATHTGNLPSLLSQASMDGEENGKREAYKHVSEILNETVRASKGITMCQGCGNDTINGSRCPSCERSNRDDLTTVGCG